MAVLIMVFLFERIQIRVKGLPISARVGPLKELHIG